MKTVLAILTIALLTAPAFAGRGDLAVRSRKAVGPHMCECDHAVATRKAVGPDLDNAVVSRKAVGPDIANAVVSRKAIGPRVQRKKARKAKLERLDTGKRALDLNAR